MAIDIDSSPQPLAGPAEGQEGYAYSRDFKVIALNILSSGSPEPINLKPMMSEFIYHEDMFAHTTTGTLLLTDSQGIIEKLSLHGNEYLRVKIAKDKESPDNSDGSTVIDKLFRLYKISHRQKTDNEATENYLIYFCSDENFVSEQYKISKSYSGKKVSEIITDILQNQLNVQDVAAGGKYDATKIEETQGVYSFIVPNFHPFEAINWVTQFALPADSTCVGADMIFFEDGYGYVFASMQTLMKQPSVYTFVYGPKNLSQEFFSDLTDQTFNVLSWKVEKSLDSLHGVNSGVFANRLISLDPLQMTANTTDFSYADYSKQAQSLNNNNPVINGLQNRNGDALHQTPMATLRMAVSNANQSQNPYISKYPGSVTKDVFIEKVLTHRKAQMHTNTYHKIRISVAGNPYFTVGQVVTFNLLSNTPSGSDEVPKELDKVYSGNYLVAATKHQIQTGGYTTMLELIKESLPNNFEEQGYFDVDNNASIWKNTVQGNLA
jgi:hypothetical protein